MKLCVMMVCLGASLVAAVAAQGPMREGRWEMTMRMQMPNVPVQMPAMKTVQCVTKAQLEGSSKGLPTSPDGQSSCKVSDYKLDGNRVTWNMACPDMTGSGEITYKADTYEGLMRLTTKQGEMTMKMSAMRLGECTP